MSTTLDDLEKIESVVNNYLCERINNFGQEFTETRIISWGDTTTFAKDNVTFRFQMSPWQIPIKLNDSIEEIKHKAEECLNNIVYQVLSASGFKIDLERSIKERDYKPLKIVYEGACIVMLDKDEDDQVLCIIKIGAGVIH